MCQKIAKHQVLNKSYYISIINVFKYYFINIIDKYIQEFSIMIPNREVVLKDYLNGL